MIRYPSGEIVLVHYPFTGNGRYKLRPGLVILDTGDDDCMVAKITSREQSSTYDVALLEWRQDGLIKPSIVRLHKLHTLEKTAIVKTLGRLVANDRQTVSAALLKIFSEWQS